LRIFKNKSFTRFARKAQLRNSALRKAVADAERGLIDADLGGGVIKQRIARQGQGKSGGFRAVILYRAKALAFFVHGFAKKDKDNVGDDELVALKQLASEMLAYDEKTIEKAVAFGVLIEVTNNGEE